MFKVDRKEINGISFFTVTSGDIYATISSLGGQLLGFGLHGQADCIWNNPDSTSYIGTAVRGGIPICFPWFGEAKLAPESVKSLINNHEQAPFHGLLRERIWHLTDMYQDEKQVMLNFTCEINPEDNSYWKHRCKVDIEYLIKDTLSVTMKISNLENEWIPVTLALHTYFHVNDINTIKLSGFAGCDYYDALNNWDFKHQTDEPDVAHSRGTARTYLKPQEHITFDDPGFSRKISLYTSNSHSSVIWNPGSERAKKLDQFSDESWKKMLCIETARVREDILSIAPYGIETIGLKVKITPL